MRMYQNKQNYPPPPSPPLPPPPPPPGLILQPQSQPQVQPQLTKAVVVYVPASSIPPNYVLATPPPPPPQQQQVQLNGQEEEEDGFFSFNYETTPFNTKEIRAAFVAKVYTLVTIQLLFTMAYWAVCIFVEPVTKHVLEYKWYYLIGSAVPLLILVFLPLCVRDIYRRYPTNYILLAVYTILFSAMISAAIVQFQASSVLIAVGITIGVCVTVYLLAAFGTLDVSNAFGALCTLVLANFFMAIILGAILVPMGYTNIYNVIYNTAGALIFSFILMMDLQRIMGDRKLATTPEDYTFAAIQVYTDIMNIFIHILAAIGKNKQ